LKKRIEGVTVYGIDIGKNTFHVVGLDSSGKPVLHSKFRRDRLLVHFANTPAALIGMESCPGSQWLARKLQTSGHTVKIIPAQFVKPYGALAGIGADHPITSKPGTAALCGNACS